MIKLIEHIAIAATDPTRLARWYCDTLDFTMLIAAEESRTYFVGLPGGGVLEIMPLAQAEQSVVAIRDRGIHHIALAVDDFAAAYQTLQTKGVDFTGPHYQAPDGGTRFDFFTDPEGNRLIGPSAAGIRPIIISNPVVEGMDVLGLAAWASVH